MKYLLDNKLAPLTFNWGFLEAPVDAVSAVLRGNCVFPLYEQASAFTTRYYSREEYTVASRPTTVDCLRIQYISGGHRVVGYIVKPRDTFGCR
jgi:hypothetical protein